MDLKVANRMQINIYPTIIKGKSLEWIRKTTIPDEIHAYQEYKSHL